MEKRRPRNLVRADSRKMLLKVKGIVMVLIVKMDFMNINSIVKTANGPDGGGARL